MAILEEIVVPNSDQFRVSKTKSVAKFGSHSFIPYSTGAILSIYVGKKKIKKSPFK